MTPSVGHIRNPTATRNNAGRTADIAGVMYRAPDGFEALTRDLTEMADAEIDTIVIDGGDGTVREVLSRAAPIWSARGLSSPGFAIIASGNTNLIARKVGSIGAGDLTALTLDRNAFRPTTIPLLQAVRSGHPPLTGFILGAGAYETATRMAQEELRARHGLQVVLAVLRLIRSPALRAPTQIGFGLDGDAQPQPRMLVGISTLPGALIYGLNPFWNDGAGPLRWLDIGANPPRLVRAVIRIIARCPARWMHPAYASGTADRITLTLSTPFVMDGESFPPGDDGLVHVSADQTATFLSRP